MADGVKQASGKLGAAIAGAGRVIADMAVGATTLDRLPTATLLGVLGGGVTTLAAYVATSFYPQLSFAVMGLLAPVVGIPCGLLIARQINKNSSEAKAEARRVLIANNRQAVEYLREDLKQPGKPAADKAKILEYIATLNEDLFEMSRIPRELQPTVKIPDPSQRLLPSPDQGAPPANAA